MYFIKILQQNPPENPLGTVPLKNPPIILEEKNFHAEIFSVTLCEASRGFIVKLYNNSDG